MPESPVKHVVLVVDDDPTSIQLLGGLLQDRYQVKIATDGDYALELAVRFQPALILLDIVMPELDGYDVCRLLKNNTATSGIPIIFLTSCTDSDKVVKGFDLGAVDYVTKPFNAGELLARVSTQLQLRQARLELEQSLEQNRLLLMEVNHRVKNNLNVVCSLLNLQANQVKDPRDAELFAEARNRVTVMASIHEALYRSTTLNSIIAGEFFTTIANKLIRAYDRRDIRIKVESGDLSLGMDELIPCGIIINDTGHKSGTTALRRTYR